jgi:transposase
VTVNEKGHAGEALRVAHERTVFREFLSRLPARSAIAVEASRSYSWIVDEMELAGHRPKLCNPFEAKRRMGLTHKTDKLDARGLAILLRNGTLPEVWIPPGELRDQRELLRLRIFLVRLRTRVKNRIHGTLSRHNVQIPGADLFGAGPRAELGARLPELPTHSRAAIEQELATLDFLEVQIGDAEKRLKAIMKVSAEADLLKTLPCVGTILSMVMMLEVGRVDRFPTAAHLASYAGLVPRVHSSGRPHANGPGLWKCEPQLEVGIRRDREFDRDQPTPVIRHACRAPVSTNKARQESPESSDGRGPPLSRSSLVGSHHNGKLSRAAGRGPGSFVNAWVSAYNCLALEAE